MSKSLNKHFSDGQILENENRILENYRKNEGHNFKIFLGLFKGNYSKLLLSSFFYILKSSPGWIIPLVTAYVIDIASLHPDDGLKKLTVAAVAILIAVLQNIPTHILHIKFLSITKRNVEAALRGAMIRKLQQLNISFHKETPSGKIQSKVMRDVEIVEEFSTQIFTTVLNCVSNMAITLSVVVSKNIYVFLMFLLTIPCASLCMTAFLKKIRNRNREFRKEIEHTSGDVMEMIELVPVTRAHALEDNEINKLTVEMASVAKRGYNLDFIQSAFNSVNWVLFTLFQLVCLFFTGTLAYLGKISIGEIALYQTYFTTLIGYVNSIISIMPTFTRGAESITSIGEILNAYDVEDNTGKQKLTDLKGTYEFKDVFFKYDEESPVLNGLNLTVNQGETVALVGESGAGKTTVLNLVVGFNKITSGEVLIDGKNINDIDLHSYRRFISTVPQKTILFSGTVRDNITYGNPRISEKQLWDAVKSANLLSVIEKLPKGIDTVVGEHGDKLSGGQKQRIAIARAIIRNPKVIIFDEATSALDSASEREIQESIDYLTKDRTTFIVAHRLSTIKNADKIAVIADGKCIEYGTYTELMEKKGEFYKLKKLQS